MATNFEKVMQACLESKKAESKRKATASKKLSEAQKRAVKQKKLKEEAEMDDELQDIVDPEDEQDVLDDVADDIVVVVDPEIDAADIDDVADELQDIIDNTPEGEVPSTDEYIDDYTYSCPICGASFFSADEMHAGDECPVCGEVPNDFVLVGQVDEVEDTEDEETAEDAEAEDDLEAAVADDEDLEVDVPEEEPVESKRRARATGYNLDESTFNAFMTKFIRENYKNAKSFKVEKAFMSKNHVLRLECSVIMKSGAKKKVTLATEAIRSKNVKARELTRVFKAESRAPFTFTISVQNKVVRCEGLKYNFNTTAKESRVNISGNLVRESKKPARRFK